MFRRVHNYNKILFARNFDHLTVPLGVTRALLLVDSKWQMTGWTKCHQNRYGSSLYPYACGRKRAPRSEHFQFFWATLMSTHREVHLDGQTVRHFGPPKLLLI